RIESATPGATWGGATLPLVVILGGDAPNEGPWRTLSGATIDGRWSRVTGDSLRLELRGATVVVGRTGTVVAKPVKCD
ncbi:MAG: hypothetical protein JWN79_1802, partial [Gemmatimonadetes bacterium]|nr:hypothetical protein [Gemmatimonadota bacterium]